MKNTITIQDYYSSVIATRKAISLLKSNIALQEKEQYVFDFSNISFISRSFADEFLKYLKSANIIWEIKNANSNIKAIIEAVRKTQESTNSNYDHIAITHFQNKRELNQFLSTF